MPSALKPGRKPAHDDLDNYAVDDDDLSDDPFASPGPPSSKKRKARDADALGIDEQVSVQKRARAPAVKLDEDRLLGPGGIPRLRARAPRGLRIKGSKGHEFADAAGLLSFYQMWLDDMFPKARFLDALAMVERAGHKRRVMAARNEWIGEASATPAAHASDADEPPPPGRAGDDDQQQQQQQPQPGRPQTPPAADVPGDDDLYDATPRAPPRDDVPADDDLDALIAEAEGRDEAARARPLQQPGSEGRDEAARARPLQQPRPSEARGGAGDAPDQDDLDALIAEAESHDQGATSARPTVDAAAPGTAQDDFADDEAAMQELQGPW